MFKKLLPFILTFAFITNALNLSGNDGLNSGIFSSTVHVLSSDTLVGTTTIDTLVDSMKVLSYKDYILTMEKFAASSGTDSLKLGVYVQALASDYSSMCTVLIDSITDTLGQQVNLRLGQKVVGDYYRVIIQGMTGNGSVIIPEDTTRIYVVDKAVKSIK